MNYVPALGDLAYHFCLALPTAFTQPGAHILAALQPDGYADHGLRRRRPGEWLENAMIEFRLVAR